MAPIDLKTPFLAGELDPGASYSRFRIISYAVNLETRSLVVVAAWQKLVEDTWVRGVVPNKKFIINGDEFEAWVTSHPELYGNTKQALYDFIQTKNPRVKGTYS